MDEIEAYKKLVAGGRKGGSAKVSKGFALPHVQAAAQKKRLKNNVMKSLLVKSIRIGWIAGMEKSRQELSRSDFESVCVAQIFEDLWPEDESRVYELAKAINKNDFEKICAWGTHHGVMGLTAQIMEKANKIVVDRDRCFEFLKSINLRTSPRAFKCLLAWLETDLVKIPRRKPDLTPWHDGYIPSSILDCHVGKWRGEKILTGTFKGHVQLSKIIEKEGWEYVREKFHKNKEPDNWTKPCLRI